MSHPRWHNLHHIFSIFEAEDTEWITVFCFSLWHVYIPHLLVHKIPSDDIPWNNFRPIMKIYLREASFSSKRRQDMYLFKQKGVTLCITGGVTENQSRLLGIPTQQAIYNQQPTHLMNSPRFKGSFKTLFVFGVRMVLRYPTWNKTRKSSSLLISNTSYFS